MLPVDMFTTVPRPTDNQASPEVKMKLDPGPKEIVPEEARETGVNRLVNV